MSGTMADFDAFRSRMNDLILGAGNLTISRFFALDGRAYEAGALGAPGRAGRHAHLSLTQRSPASG
jgi:hypothetical protein